MQIQGNRGHIYMAAHRPATFTNTHWIGRTSANSPDTQLPSNADNTDFEYRFCGNAPRQAPAQVQKDQHWTHHIRLCTEKIYLIHIRGRPTFNIYIAPHGGGPTNRCAHTAHVHVYVGLLLVWVSCLSCVAFIFLHRIFSFQKIHCHSGTSGAFIRMYGCHIWMGAIWVIVGEIVDIRSPSRVHTKINTYILEYCKQNQLVLMMSSCVPRRRDGKAGRHGMHLKQRSLSARVKNKMPPHRGETKFFGFHYCNRMQCQSLFCGQTNTIGPKRKPRQKMFKMRFYVLLDCYSSGFAFGSLSSPFFFEISTFLRFSPNQLKICLQVAAVASQKENRYSVPFVVCHHHRKFNWSGGATAICGSDGRASGRRLRLPCDVMTADEVSVEDGYYFHHGWSH